MDATVNIEAQPKEGAEIPNWAYGVIAGGCVAIAGGVMMTYHFLSKKRRRVRAQVNAAAYAQIEVDRLTPRDVESEK